jgi:heme/copper-type cytochrome/quinol oxidase subunit 2
MGLVPGSVGTLAALHAVQTNLQQTNALVWVMVGISVSGSIVTFAFLVYSVWKWRDHATNRRRYG